VRNPDPPFVAVPTDATGPPGWRPSRSHFVGSTTRLYPDGCVHGGRMSDWTGTPMDEAEVTEFLEARGTGVLSLAMENDGYGFPVSYAYDGDEDAVYFRLGFGADSQKRPFVDAVERASLVVYDETDEGWKSAVVEGTLSELAPNALESSLAEDVRGFRIPYFAVFLQASNELDFSLYRLSADSVTGVVEGR